MDLYFSVLVIVCMTLSCFFFNDTATTEIYTDLHTLSLHDALPISASESLVLLGRDVLVAEEDHQMVQESLPNFRDRIVVERLRQIDSANLRAERAGDRMHLDPVERIGDSVRTVLGNGCQIGRAHV